MIKFLVLLLVLCLMLLASCIGCVSCVSCRVIESCSDRAKEIFQLNADDLIQISGARYGLTELPFAFVDH